MIDYAIRRRHSVFKDPKSKAMDIPPDAVQLAWLSAILTIIVTVVYMVIYIIYLVSRYTQNTSIDDLNGSDFFIHILKEVYIKEKHSINGLPANLTTSFTICRLVIVAIALSLLSLLCAGRLIWTICDKKQSHCFINMAYLTVLPFLLSLGVDLIFVFFLGWDYGNLSRLLDRNVAGNIQNYTKDTVRLVALFLITIALKGYVLHVMQGIFLTMLVMKAYQMDMALEPTLNRMSILKAYELKKKRPEEKPVQAVSEFDISRHGAVDDDISNYSTCNSFEPIEVSKQLVPVDVQWHRDDYPSTSRARTQPVPIPPPDYSPEPTRRLKPALKSSYQI